MPDAAAPHPIGFVCFLVGFAFLPGGLSHSHSRLEVSHAGGAKRWGERSTRDLGCFNTVPAMTPGSLSEKASSGRKS